MSSFKLEKKEEEDSGGICSQCRGGGAFANLDKTSVLQETRLFNQTPVNHRKCSHILAKILYLLNQGQELTCQEATDAFFATTKLFQSKDVALRRMVYLVIKELSSIAQDVIIVTSSLTRDMTGDETLYRAPAIRALYTITDPTMLQAIERYMKQAIVDQNPAVSSAALVTALHLWRVAPDLVRRWASEAQEAVRSDNNMVSYHALGVLVAARRHDKLSTSKLVLRLTSPLPTSPYALCLLIRIAAHLLKGNPCHELKQFINLCLRHKSEMVIYEAAHAIVNLKHSKDIELAGAVSALKLFCTSSNPSSRLAGARTLARLVERHPTAVTTCSINLQNLITDSNRSIATLAVSTLLSTASESSVDRLMKQILTFVSEVPDEFKIIVVRAIKRLCSKFPRKLVSLAAFLAGLLRDEGGYDYKAAIVEALIALVEETDAKETGLAHLCEFIEDCEHATLAVTILHVLGKQGPKASNPSRYIRYIYNRVVLESGPVRAAAVTAIAKFGAQRPELLPTIRILLQRCQVDEDDEVRDRAVLYSAILNTEDQKLIEEYIINVPIPNPVLLESALRNHLMNHHDVPFDLLSVPNEDQTDIKVEAPVKSQQPSYRNLLDALPGSKIRGELFKSSELEQLTEPETEYQVSVIKHVYSQHVILQFECINTLSDQILDRVQIRLKPPPGYRILVDTICKRLTYNRPDNVYVVLQFPANATESLGSFGACLEFSVRDCDSNTGIPEADSGYDDKYLLEEFEVGCRDQIRVVPSTVAWDTPGTTGASQTYTLDDTEITEACELVCRHLGVPPTCVKETAGSPIREIRAGAQFRDGSALFVVARLVSSGRGVCLQIVAKSARRDLVDFVQSAVA